MTPHQTRPAPALAHERGFSLVEMLVSMALATVIMGATLGALYDAIRANEATVRMTGMNETLRLSMDLLVRDLLQVASGLPQNHVINTPTGNGSQLIRIPGPPGTAFTNVPNDPDIAAIVPGTGLGPVVNGVATDTITILSADNTFFNQAVTAVSGTTVTVAPGPNIASGPDRVTPGQLMMVSKDSRNTLVQVTGVDTMTRMLTFAAGDSLNLNQPAAAINSLAALNAAAPANNPGGVRLRRIRMITYYIDATTANEPRLVRRVNNGHPTAFNNTLGTAVGMDVDGLRISYGLAAGAANSADVRFTAADLGGTGACAPNACSVLQVRKVNLQLTARSNNADQPGARIFHNVLSSQVSLRSMTFINEYVPPPQ